MDWTVLGNNQRVSNAVFQRSHIIIVVGFVKIANRLSLAPWMILLKVGVLAFTELDFRQFVYFMGNVSGKLNMNSNNE